MRVEKSNVVSYMSNFPDIYIKSVAYLHRPPVRHTLFKKKKRRLLPLQRTCRSIVSQVASSKGFIFYIKPAATVVCSSRVRDSFNFITVTECTGKEVSLYIYIYIIGTYFSYLTNVRLPIRVQSFFLYIYIEYFLEIERTLGMFISNGE